MPKIILINNLMKLILVFLFLLPFAKNSSSEEIYCQPLAVEKALKIINNKIGNSSIYRFMIILSDQTDEKLQKAYSKIKIENLRDNEYSVVVTTVDLDKIYQKRIKLNDDLDQLKKICIKENNQQCYVLALYNNEKKLCLIFSVDYYKSGDALIDGKGVLPIQRYQMGN